MSTSEIPIGQVKIIRDLVNTALSGMGKTARDLLTPVPLNYPGEEISLPVALAFLPEETSEEMFYFPQFVVVNLFWKEFNQFGFEAERYIEITFDNSSLKSVEIKEGRTLVVPDDRKYPVNGSITFNYAYDHDADTTVLDVWYVASRETDRRQPSSQEIVELVKLLNLAPDPLLQTTMYLPPEDLDMEMVNPWEE